MFNILTYNNYVFGIFRKISNTKHVMALNLFPNLIPCTMESYDWWTIQITAYPQYGIMHAYKMLRIDRNYCTWGGSNTNSSFLLKFCHFPNLVFMYISYRHIHFSFILYEVMQDKWWNDTKLQTEWNYAYFNFLIMKKIVTCV